MLKFVVVGTVSLALVGTAVAADLPRPQPVVQTAPVGKWPDGMMGLVAYTGGGGPVPHLLQRPARPSADAAPPDEMQVSTSLTRTKAVPVSGHAGTIQ